MLEKKKKILVVDDSLAIRKLIKLELEKGNYEVFEADNGITALTKVCDIEPDLITLDIEMPKLNGLETLEKLRSEPYSKIFSNYRDNQIPVIFVTGNDILEDRMNGYKLGAADFITKPFAKGELVSAVNKILKPEKRLERLTALVVDDDPVSRLILIKLLKRDGLCVITAKDGNEAFSILCNQKNEVNNEVNKDEINIVLTDLNMPIMKGDELCKKVRNELGMKHIPIIVLTATDEQSEILNLFKAGATDYLVKPFVKEELLARLTVHMELKQALETAKAMVKLEQERSTELDAVNKELSQYTSIVSHDLKAPLRAINNYANFLYEDLSENLEKEHKEYLDKIMEASIHSQNLIDDLLQLARIGKGKIVYEKIKTGAFLNDFIKSLNLPSDVKISIDDNWPSIETETTLFKQVFQNLITNAVKFNKSQCKTIELGHRSYDDKNYEFFVKDNGIGVDPKHCDQIFEVFKRLHTNEEYEGTGIGLSIIKKAVKKMGGTIRLESELGKGSTFFIVLPKNINNEI